MRDQALTLGEVDLLETLAFYAGEPRAARLIGIGVRDLARLRAGLPVGARTLWALHNRFASIGFLMNAAQLIAAGKDLRRRADLARACAILEANMRDVDTRAHCTPESDAKSPTCAH